MIQEVQTATQPLRNASDVLHNVYMDDVVLYLWHGEQRTGKVSGWRAVGYGYHRQHMISIFRGENGRDREIPLSDVIARIL